MDKRFSRGLQFNSSYSVGKSIDSSSTTNLGACLANPFNVRDDRGRADWDRRHAFVVSGIWSLPFYGSQQGVLGRAFGGWSISGISNIQSGAPITFTTGQNTALDGNICGGDALHADIVGLPERAHSSRSDQVSQFFNRDAFVLPQLGKYGSAGRGILSGPAQVTTDIALLKDVFVRERYRFQIRGEFSNVFNQVNFSNPVARLSNARYGQIIASQPGRAVQVGLKFVW